MKKTLPKFVIDHIERQGGILLETDPPNDVEGWVLSVNGFDPVAKIETNQSNFLFLDMSSANAALVSLHNLAEFTPGLSRVSLTKDFFYCAHCGSKRRDVRHLFQGLSGPSICDGCVRNLNSELAKLK